MELSVSFKLKSFLLCFFLQSSMPARYHRLDLPETPSSCEVHQQALLRAVCSNCGVHSSRGPPHPSSIVSSNPKQLCCGVTLSSSHRSMRLNISNPYTTTLTSGKLHDTVQWPQIKLQVAFSASTTDQNHQQLSDTQI